MDEHGVGKRHRDDDLSRLTGAGWRQRFLRGDATGLNHDLQDGGGEAAARGDGGQRNEY